MSPPARANGSAHHIHQLSPTFFLPRAAAIEPHAHAVVHKTANGKMLRRTYQETADRARGLAYYIKHHGFKRVGILCTNTPAFFESIYGIGGAMAVNVAVNYRLKMDDITYIFEHADVDMIIVDAEFRHLLDAYHQKHPGVPFVVDTDTDQDTGDYDKAVLLGLQYDAQSGGHGWAGLETQVSDEDR
jgi:acyl-CoA synthetase (AMP-forming)/AMP-acid ligase II